jgi:geranylgeranyl pyrophosphate synthase
VGPDDRRRIATVLEDRAFSRVAPEEVLEMVRAEGTVEEARAIAEDYACRAREQLAAFPPSEVREALELAPDFVLNRRS